MIAYKGCSSVKTIKKVMFTDNIDPDPNNQAFPINVISQPLFL
jgi:hypothetical protein